jgi:hypothetical protein
MITIENYILQAIASRPNEWLNCAGQYIGEVLALQCKGLLVSRMVGNQLQVHAN